MCRTIRRGCDTARFLAVPVSSEGSVSRRSALKLGSGGALALVIGLGAGWLDRRGDDPTTAGPDEILSGSTSSTTSSTTTTTTAPVVIDDIGEVDAAIITLGRRVIEVTGEDDAGALLATLPGGTGDPLARARTRVRDDFRAGDTIVVDGWVLAASEARAAAVLALLCDDGC